MRPWETSTIGSSTGSTTGANPDLGRELFESAVAQLTEQLREIARFEFRS